MQNEVSFVDRAAGKTDHVPATAFMGYIDGIAVLTLNIPSKAVDLCSSSIEVVLKGNREPNCDHGALAVGSSSLSVGEIPKCIIPMISSDGVDEQEIS